jgi:hypothetical protein
MCREHALMTAGLGALLGFRAYLAWGKLALVGDEEGVSAKRMMSVSDPHSWTMFEGIGVYDLSLNLTQAAEIKWKPWPTHSSCRAFINNCDLLSVVHLRQIR